MLKRSFCSKSEMNWEIFLGFRNYFNPSLGSKHFLSSKHILTFLVENVFRLKKYSSCKLKPTRNSSQLFPPNYRSQERRSGVFRIFSALFIEQHYFNRLALIFFDPFLPSGVSPSAKANQQSETFARSSCRFSRIIFVPHFGNADYKDGCWLCVFFVRYN